MDVADCGPRRAPERQLGAKHPTYFDRSTASIVTAAEMSKRPERLGTPDRAEAGDMPDHETEYDVVISGGRVIDPDPGLDETCKVGLLGDRIAAVSRSALWGRREINAYGVVVARGFIDLQSHGQAIGECRLQALDGVTTALELEAGVTRVAVA